MSKLYPYLDDVPDSAQARCDNCGQVYKVVDLAGIRDPGQRMGAGNEVPAGECPASDCGALCYLLKKEGKEPMANFDACPACGNLEWGQGIIGRRHVDVDYDLKGVELGSQEPEDCDHYRWACSNSCPVELEHFEKLGIEPPDLPDLMPLRPRRTCYTFSVGDSENGPISYCADVVARTAEEAFRLLMTGAPETLELEAIRHDGLGFEVMPEVRNFHVHFNLDYFLRDGVDFRDFIVNEKEA